MDQISILAKCSRPLLLREPPVPPGISPQSCLATNGHSQPLCCIVSHL